MQSAGECFVLDLDAFEKEARLITEPQYWRSSETAFSEYEILPDDFPETEDMAPEPLDFRGNSFEIFRIDDLAEM